jgi:hypothetical protein
VLRPLLHRSAPDLILDKKPRVARGGSGAAFRGPAAADLESHAKQPLGARTGAKKVADDVVGDHQQQDDEERDDERRVLATEGQ